MRTIDVKQFKENLKHFATQVIAGHSPLKVCDGGEEFVVVNAEDWEREQETMRVMQDTELVRQIAASTATHAKGTGYQPTAEEMDEITGI